MDKGFLIYSVLLLLLDDDIRVKSMFIESKNYRALFRHFCGKEGYGRMYGIFAKAGVYPI